ncbi:ATP-dependent DNA helicase RecG [Desnuesiella massiliensis]|uniref:ATP-dependent DNA helicase RecG n=1 Tax=Desnuesiella massiliensis TaxID=1650662 RepID=UPI0006E3FA32|nr:ATP-dependent DNA helicase RecG [Desnuesiella massiliensis]
MNIYNDISALKGVGPKIQEALGRCGINNILDLLLYFPRDYEFTSVNVDMDDIDEEEKRVLECEYIQYERDIRTKTGKTLTTLIFKYGELIIKAKWFNQPYIKKTFVIGGKYNLYGKFKKCNTYLETVNPVIINDAINKSGIIAKYSLNSALTNKLLLKLVNQALEEVRISENLPRNIVSKYNFISLDKAIRSIHFPVTKGELEEAVRRLKFQELLTYSIKILMVKKLFKSNKRGIAFNICDEMIRLKEQLPFSLTNAQSRVIREILIDEKKPLAMNRLVQGDVGSGKTIVAVIAMFNVVKNGYQAVLMAPTEILANQHYKEIRKLLMNFHVDVEILTGSTSSSEKTRIKEKIKEGTPLVLIGTHALIEEDVELNKLGIIVTDEQHRFGVNQRSKLINKNNQADVLVMTATPIPRTLSLYLYSDLDVSIIDELPPGRQKIDTVFYEERHRKLAYNLALEQIKLGRQVYIVCPLIEENEDLKLNSVEKLYDSLKSEFFKEIPIEILHGKMNSKTKEEIMSRFKENNTKVLISTTVIEVGVNVPNASVMIIENAERFGLSQLHQLRGRVGRGQYKSYCILIANAKSNITKKRMMTMTESNDGFYIAEQDLKLRGSGELFGTRQHGDTGLILSDIMEDINLLKVANAEAKGIVYSEDEINMKFCEEVMKGLEKSSKYICFN